MDLVGELWLNTLVWVVGLAIVFGILARLMPCNPGLCWWRNLRAALTDFMYWFVMPALLRICRLILLIAGIMLFYGGREPHFWPVQQLPLWLQCLAILLIQDVLLYWIHRGFHRPWAWPFHAIHHSPPVVDWMTASRFHPINHLLAFGVADVAVLLLGFAPAALAVLVPFNIIYSAMVHANLNWTFGPLRYVLASPVFHRWHHTTRAEGQNKNFASTFSFLDGIFGTFFMPARNLPAEFGNGVPDFPEDFWAQFLHPLRKGKPQVSNFDRPEITTKQTGAWHGHWQCITTLLSVSILAGGTCLGARTFLTAGYTKPTEAGTTTVDRLQTQGPWAEGTRPVIPSEPMAAVLSVAISPDGGCIIWGSADGTVNVEDGAADRVKHTFRGHSRAVRCVAISADGQRIMSASEDGTIKVWNRETGQEKLTLRGHNAAVLSVAIDPNGRQIVSGSVDFNVKLWDAATGQEKLTLQGPPGAVVCVAISPDGQRVVSAHGTKAKVWDARTGREILTFHGHRDLVAQVTFSPDGQRIISASFDKTVKVWDAKTGQEKLTLQGHRGPVYGVAISGDGTRIVSGSDDNTVKTWDAATGKLELTIEGHTGAITSVAVSADGQHLVSGSRDGTRKVWDLGAHPSDKASAAR
jgi:sterol desaturase/sphingolipid hydroxylase (fatty acid hydroxylase superfamily)